MTEALRILLVGGAASELCLAAGMARDLGAEVFLAETVPIALDRLRSAGSDLVLVEVSLSVGELVSALRVERIRVPVLACGVQATPEQAVAAIRAGARDYVPLPPERELIAAVLASISMSFEVLVGSESGFRSAIALAIALAPSPLPLLIMGEPGCGKESFARLIHRHSGAAGPFITVECAGLPTELLESELFGHREGAFEGAVADRTGRIVQAAGGSLLLRSIEMVPPEQQGRLVAAIDRGLTRLLATSSADLAALVEQGQFRADLLDRLHSACVAVPSLRERGDDIEALSEHFAIRCAQDNGVAERRFADGVLGILRAHSWPGNVRELEQLIQRAVLISFGERITGSDLVLENGRPLARPAVPQQMGGSGSQHGDVAGLVGSRVGDVERALILSTLQRCGGNRTSASTILGISIRTMRNKLRSFTDAGYPVAPAA